MRAKVNFEVLASAWNFQASKMSEIFDGQVSQKIESLDLVYKSEDLEVFCTLKKTNPTDLKMKAVRMVYKMENYYSSEDLISLHTEAVVEFHRMASSQATFFIIFPNYVQIHIEGIFKYSLLDFFDVNFTTQPTKTIELVLTMTISNIPSVTLLIHEMKEKNVGIFIFEQVRDKKRKKTVTIAKRLDSLYTGELLKKPVHIRLTF
jgi:hypothetical protein